MTAQFVTAALILGALLLTLVVPHLLTRWTGLRRAPGEALALWQAVSITGVLCALLATPVAAFTFGSEQPRLLAAALLVSGLMLARLLWSGHRVGTDLRRMRRQHRDIVDLVGQRLAEPTRSATGQQDRVTVVASASPTAYCLPGRRDRIVLSQGAVEALTEDELTAVLQHEQAHLRQRHDLLLELFTVLHETVPPRLRAPKALAEVHLLVEMLADRAATRSGSTDEPTLARALVTMARASARTPQATPPPVGASAHHVGHPAPAAATAYPAAVPAGGQVRERLHALAHRPPRRLLRASILGLAGLHLALPPVLLLTLLA